MLQTTVNYLSLLENKRHNLVAEKQNEYQLSLNARDTAVREGALAETSRHNRETESQGWASIIETTRHNMATEGINAYDAETRRRQLSINQQQADAATMNAYTNRYAAEQQAGIGWANVGIGWANVDVNQQNADTRLLEANNQYENYQHSWGVNLTNAQANLKNAMTNSMNAETRLKEYDWNVTYGTQNLEISQQNADTNRMDSIWRNAINTYSAINDAVDSKMKIANDTWKTLFGTGSLKPKFSH